VADSIFDQMATALEDRTSLDRLAARGTLRLALKQAGLDAATVTFDQLRVVLEKVLPAELEALGIEAPTELCERLAADHAGLESAMGPAVDSPEAVFTRLAAN
jgi:hypothetical protein